MFKIAALFEKILLSDMFLARIARRGANGSPKLMARCRS
jgi:hypothetical protein